MTVHVDTADGVVFGSTLSGKPTAAPVQRRRHPDGGRRRSATPRPGPAVPRRLRHGLVVPGARPPAASPLASPRTDARRRRRFVVGTGDDLGTAGAGRQCDEDHSCRLAVAVYVSVNGGRGQWIVDSSARPDVRAPDPLLAVGRPTRTPSLRRHRPAVRRVDGLDAVRTAPTPPTRTGRRHGRPRRRRRQPPRLRAGQRGPRLRRRAPTPALLGGAATRPSVAVPSA